MGKFGVLVNKSPRKDKNNSIKINKIKKGKLKSQNCRPIEFYHTRVTVIY